MTLPERNSLPIIVRYSFVCIDPTTARGDGPYEPLQVWTQCRWRFSHGFAYVDLPQMVEFDGEVYANSRQPKEII
jgi:hypothetical protein